MKARAASAGRRTLVWAALGVCSVMLVKAVVIGGLGSATFALLDPRFGGVDGLGVLTSRPAAPARQEELATVGRSFDSFRAARGTVAGAVPTHTLQGSVFGDDGAGKLPGVNQNAWLASRAGEGVQFFDSKPRFVRAVPHPRRPSMLHRVSAGDARGALASMRSHRTPNALVRMASRNSLMRERARLARLNEHSNAVGVLGRMPSSAQPTTSQFLRSAGEFDNSAGGALFRTSTTPTSVGGSLSPNFQSDAGNANGALAAVHGDKSWAQPAHDYAWAQAVKDNGWATPTHDNGWAAESKQNGWASAVHDNGWASAPSASASHGALLSMRGGNSMGSLSELKGRQNAWSQEPSRAEKMGALASMRGGNDMGSLSAVHDGGKLNSMGSLSRVQAGTNTMGSLSQVKASDVNSMGSLASVQTDPETNGALSNFKQNQAEIDGSLSTLQGDQAATDGSLSGIKGVNFAGSLAATKGSDAAGSLSDVKGSDVWGSLSSSDAKDMAGGVLSVTTNTHDVGGSLAGFTYGKQGEMVGGSLANTKGSDVGGSLSDVKSSMVQGALQQVGGKVDKSEMVGGALSAVSAHPQGLGWLAQAPGLRGRMVDRGAGDAVRKAPTASATAPQMTETAKEVQKTAEEAAALKYMLGKELNEASEMRAAQAAEIKVKDQEKLAAQAAEKKVKEQEQALEHLLKASKEKVEKVQAKVQAAAAKVVSEAKGKPAPLTTSAVKGMVKGASAGGQAPRVAAKRPQPAEHHTAPAASAVRDTMHVAKGQQKKQQKLDEEGEPLDQNEDDIGWHKSHWSTLAWVMFIMFGPVFTTAVVGLVGYYTGTVAALATCLLLVCMDIACYYYSWFLW